MPIKQAHILLFVCGIAIPALLVALAWPRMLASAEAESALPVVTARLLQEPRSPLEYRQAAAALAGTLPGDGDGLIRQAEMITLAAGGKGAALSTARMLTVAGLHRAPTNPRGWTLLCEIDATLSPARAAHCMETGLSIAPFDWFTAGRRAVLAAYLWPRLSPEARSIAARRVKQMWDSDVWPDHRVKEVLFDVYMTPNGPALLKAGFAGDKGKMRELNVWLIHKRMYGPR